MNRYALFATVLCASAVLMPQYSSAGSPAAGKAEASSKLEFERDAEMLRESLIEGLAELGGKEVHPESEAKILYPEREHERRRQDLRAKIITTNQLMASLIQRNDPSHAETIRSIFKDKLNALVDPEHLKSFDEGFAASIIKKQVPSIIRNDRILNSIKNELLAVEKIKDRPEKIRRLEAVTPKLLEAAGVKDSSSARSGMTAQGASELKGYSEWADATGNKFSLSSLFKYLADNSTQDPEIDPDRQLRRIKSMYNSIIDARNDTVEQFEAQSSPEWVLRKTGLKKFERLDEK